MRFNLRELYRANGTRKPFLGDPAQLAALPFMAEYLANVEGLEIAAYTQIDRNLARTHGLFEPLYNAPEIGTENIDDVLDEFKQDVFALLVKNRVAYQHLFDLNGLEYDPIANYDKHSTVTTKHDGTENTTANNGDHSETHNTGAQQSSTNYGKQDTTNKYGNVSTQDSIGQVTVTTDHKVSGYNDTSMTEASQDVQATAASTNGHTEQARTDTESTAEHTDTVSNGAREDSVTTTQTKDATTNTESNFTDTVTDETKGNIGVTTTQQMMESEVKFWDSYNFYDKIFDDVLKTLCTRYDGGYDPLETPLFNALKRGEY